jgi:uncharacterized protein YuzE
MNKSKELHSWDDEKIYFWDEERKKEWCVSDELESIPYLLKMPSKRIWVDYDDEADVLYISFRKPQQANDSIMEDDIIYHYHDKELVGLTILHTKGKS